MIELQKWSDWLSRKIFYPREEKIFSFYSHGLQLSYRCSDILTRIENFYPLFKKIWTKYFSTACLENATKGTHSACKKLMSRILECKFLKRIPADVRRSGSNQTSILLSFNYQGTFYVYTVTEIWSLMKHENNGISLTLTKEGGIRLVQEITECIPSTDQSSSWELIWL